MNLVLTPCHYFFCSMGFWACSNTAICGLLLLLFPKLEEQPKASFASMSVFPRQLENQRFSCHVDYLTVNREDQSICLDSGF
ncbi:ER lumen protein-retaining receptor [Trifolium repens]|nr:ER lumen protein-retaining receptor [Trifolium repens]